MDRVPPAKGKRAQSPKRVSEKILDTLVRKAFSRPYPQKRRPGARPGGFAFFRSELADRSRRGARDSAALARR